MTEYEKMKITYVSKELKNRVENVVLDCLDKAQARFGVEKVKIIPKILYDTTGRSAGLACWNRGEPWISQEFIGGEVQYEDEEGEAIFDFDEPESGLTIDMIQPVW